MHDASATLGRLNLETRAYHAAADAGWRALLTTDLTKGRYAAQLMRVYGFEAPLEAALAYTPNLDLLVDIHERFRAGFIAQDLLALGYRPAEVAHLPQCVLAPFTSPLEALGWLYVLERSTLTHDEIRRYVSVRLPQAKDACVYLCASDGLVQSRWQDLGRRIERALRSPRMFDDVVAGAHAAFRCWLDWCEREPTLQRLALR